MKISKPHGFMTREHMLNVAIVIDILTIHYLWEITSNAIVVVKWDGVEVLKSRMKILNGAIMKKGSNEISRGYGQVYLAQAIIDILETLSLSKESDQNKVLRMIKELSEIRNYECRKADGLFNKL